MDISSIAVQGLDQANAQVGAAASAIGVASTAGSGGVDVVNLSADMVALATGQNLFEANVAALKTAEQVQKSLLDITG